MATEIGTEAGRRPIATVPDAVWEPLVTGGLVLVVGLAGLAVGQPWLFPSLGPTAFLQAKTPTQPSSRAYNTVAGHLVGLASGFAAVALLGAYRAPGVLASQELTPARLGATALAVALTMLGMLLLRAAHPPAVATAMLIGEGSYKLSWHDALMIVIGVAIIAVAGEGLRRLRLRFFPSPGR